MGAVVSTGDTALMDTEGLVRRVFDAFNSRELGTHIELLDRDVEIVPARAALEDIVYRGHDGVWEFERDSEATWSVQFIEILDLEVSGEQALVIGRLCLTGRSSGARTEVPTAWAVSVRDGRVTRLATYLTEQDARQQLGWKA